MTAREVSTVIKGVAWRHKYEEQSRLRLAWRTAAFQRAKRLPDLQRLLKATENERKRMTPAESWEWAKGWAVDSGLKITRHPKPVVLEPRR